MQTIKNLLLLTAASIALLFVVIGTAVFFGTSFGVSSYIFTNEVAMASGESNDATTFFYPGFDDELARMRDILVKNNLLGEHDLSNILSIYRFVLADVRARNVYFSEKTPLRLYNACRLSQGGQCAEFSIISSGFLAAAGYKARVVSLWSNFMLEHGLTHTSVEVFVPDLNKWIFIDPLFRAYFKLNGTLLSAKELGDVFCELTDVSKIRMVRFDPHGVAPRWEDGYFLLFNNVAYYDRLKLTDWKNDFRRALLNIGQESRLLIHRSCEGKNVHKIIRAIHISHIIVKHLLPPLFFTAVLFALVFIFKLVYGRLRSGAHASKS